MSVARSCAPCRRSKVKCDRVRPICSRCSRLDLRCGGYQTNDGFVCENEIARRNSRRARGELSNGVRHDTPLSVNGDYLATDLEWLSQNVRLNLPEPLKRDKEARAVDRFFVNWILHPGRDGISPGHLVHLPLLYYQSDSDCILWHATRAMAFADVKNERNSEGVPFHIKARNSYGKSLSHIRQAVQNEEKLSDDRTLAALLLIDSFESMYLAQPEPLGPHIVAIRHILTLRGTEQLYDRSRFSLFRAANCRLQSRQIMRGEDPEPIQEELLRKLDAQRPDIHIALDIMRMSHLCAGVRSLLDKPTVDLEKVQSNSTDEIVHLTMEIEVLLDHVLIWRSTATGIWKPKTVDSTSKAKSYRESRISDHPLAHLEGPTLHTYSHVWFAYIWNFHAASQIVLREHLIRLFKYQAMLQRREIDQERFSRERNAIENLSSSIMKSLPPLMGFTDQDGGQAATSPQGLMAGRFLALFALDVVARSEYTSSEHKSTAKKVEEWIRASHALR